MKTAEFNDLCNREHARDGGVVAALHLTRESLRELTTEIIAGQTLETDPFADGTACGARLDAMTNPATRTVVKVRLAAPFVPDTAVVACGPDGFSRAVVLTG